MIAMSPLRKSPGAFYKKSPHLIWEDQPVRQVAATKSITRVCVAADRILSVIPLPFEQALLRLARSLGCMHMDAYIGETEKNLFLYDLDTAPQHASPEAVEAIAEALLQKTLQTV